MSVKTDLRNNATTSIRIITPDPLLLTPEPLLLHRVDASQLQAPVRVVNGDPEEHPADENQGRGLDHLAGPSYLSSVTWWLVAGVVFFLLALAQVFMGDQL